MKQKKTAILLINVGTPDSTRVKDVRKYLSEFLNDIRVIDLPWLFQKMLVNLIIVPFRAPKSAKLYEQLWTNEGSPLVVYGQKLVDRLNDPLKQDSKAFLAMRYRNPKLTEVLQQIKKEGFTRLIVVPLFPQYASSTTGTSLEAVYKNIRKDVVVPEVISINQFYQHPLFVKAFAERIRSYQPEQFDHIIFSYHGLPMRQVQKTHPSVSCATCTCETALPDHGRYCYKAACYETTRLIAAELHLSSSAYTVSFQSRLSNNWLTPFTDKTLAELAKSGKKKILITAPSFVTDCLETIVELGIDYKKQFTENGGSELQMVESLNDSPSWIKALKGIIEEYIPH